MAAMFIIFGENIEEEGLHIVVESLVVEEEFGEKTEILTIDLIGITVHLEHRQVFTSIDFVGRRMI